MKLNNENTAFELDREGPIIPESNAAYEFSEFVNTLPPDECRYIVYDVEGQGASGTLQSKLLLISWVPESATIMHKMLYSSSKEALKLDLKLTKQDMLVNDRSELTYDLACEKAGII